MRGGIKRTGKGTEKRGRPKSRAKVAVERGSTRAGGKRRAGRETVGRGTENSALTNVVVAKTGAIISESPIMTIVNILDAERVRALSKCHLPAILLLLLLCFPPLFFTQLLIRREECRHIGHLEFVFGQCHIALLLCFSAFFHSPLDLC